MARTLFRANFPGIRLRITERKGNPCRVPSLQNHYFPGFKLVSIETSRNHKNYFWVKLVRVRRSWNEHIKDHSKKGFRDCFITIEPDEVVLAVHHISGCSNGVVGDILTFTFKSTVDGFLRTHSTFIPLKDQMRMPTHSPNAAL